MPDTLLPQISELARSSSHSDQEGHRLRRVCRRRQRNCGERGIAQPQDRRRDQDQGHLREKVGRRGWDVVGAAAATGGYRLGARSTRSICKWHRYFLVPSGLWCEAAYLRHRPECHSVASPSQTCRNAISSDGKCVGRRAVTLHLSPATLIAYLYNLHHVCNPCQQMWHFVSSVRRTSTGCAGFLG